MYDLPWNDEHIKNAVAAGYHAMSAEIVNAQSAKQMALKILTELGIDTHGI